MRRMIFEFKRMKHISGCCPGHDSYPCEAYRNNRSKTARSKSKKLENRLARRKASLMINSQLTNVL